MAQYIPGNNSFMRDSATLNNQLMQQNRDRTNRATKMFEMATQTGDVRGMAEARNILEGKGFLSKHFGIGGKYNTPYNRDQKEQSQEQVPDSQKLQGLKSEKQGLIGEVEQRKQARINDAKSPRWINSEELRRQEMISGDEITRQEQRRVIPKTPGDIAEDQYIKDKARRGDPRIDEVLAGSNKYTTKAQQDIDNTREETDYRLKNDYFDKDPDQIASDKVKDIDSKIKQEAVVRREQIANAPKQVKGQVRQNWKEIRKTGLGQGELTGDYSNVRDIINNTGSDAIASANGYEAKLKVWRELRSKLFLVDDYFKNKQPMPSPKSFGIEKPKYSGRGVRKQKLTPYNFTDSKGVNHTLKLDENSPNYKGQNKAKIEAFMKRSNLPFDETVYSAFSPKSKNKGINEKEKQRIRDEEAYALETLRKEVESPLFDNPSKFASDSKQERADAIFKKTGVRFKVAPNGDVSIRSRGTRPLNGVKIGYNPSNPLKKKETASSQIVKTERP